MSESPNQADAPMSTAGVAPVKSSKVVSSVVETVQAHPAVAPAAAPSIIANILAGLYQAEPAIFAVTRASPKTQAAVGVGVGLAEVILGAFLNRAGA